MNEQTNQPIIQSPNTLLPHFSDSPKEAWSEPVLQKTPIAETAGSKTTAIGDGVDAFSS